MGLLQQPPFFFEKFFCLVKLKVKPSPFKGGKIW